MQIKIKRLHNDAKIPTYAKPGDAGMDITATSITHTNDYIEYGTGLSFEIPKGYVGLLFPRSSNSKKDLALCNSVGVLDSGYRGEVTFRFKNIRRFTGELFPQTKEYVVGDKIGQIVVIPYPEVTFVESTDLSKTERGSSGYGSTGA